MIAGTNNNSTVKMHFKLGGKTNLCFFLSIRIRVQISWFVLCVMCSDRSDMQMSNQCKFDSFIRYPISTISQSKRNETFAFKIIWDIHNNLYFLSH